jgi:hypothetical protein
MEDADQRPAVAGQVERSVRPRAWACVWPDDNGCGGGAFTTMSESTARNYMDGANESADAGRSQCRPSLVPLYDQAALDAAVAAERERILALCQGKTHEGCTYLARCGTVCNKCGQVA